MYAFILTLTELLNVPKKNITMDEEVPCVETSKFNDELKQIDGTTDENVSDERMDVCQTK